jgi:hypothetical protein
VRSLRTLTLFLAVIGLLLFARLAQRHVGESYFLADQVDQLEKYEAALRLEPEGLWGPAMSGTAARALGPLGALVFGLPVSLGLGIDAIQRVTSLLLAIAAAIALWQLWRIDVVFAWVWFIVFTAMRMVWWNAAMFWVNTLLLPLGLLLLALFAATLRHPSWTRVAALVLTLCLALQIHLVALVGVPIVLAAIVCTYRAGSSAVGHGRSFVALSVVAAGIVVAFLPYAGAEVQTGFRNTRAMVSHVDAAVHRDAAVGARAAFESLGLATDPTGVLADRQSSAVVIGSALTIAALGLLIARRRSLSPPAMSVTGMVWLVGTGVVAVTGQALFFLAMARPLNGMHYVMLLAPWYPIPLSALVAALVPASPGVRRMLPLGLGLVGMLLLVWRAPLLADRFAERTAWNYRAIVTALDRLCAGEAVQTLEGPGLTNDLTPSADSVLQYLLKRGHSRCRYDVDADVLIAGSRSGEFDDRVTAGGKTFTRQAMLPPGLARYKRFR